MERPDITLRERASAQHGVVALADARAVGVTDRQLDRRLATGELVAEHRGVYRVLGAPPSPEQTLLAAVMGAGRGAAASHRSAAWVWDLPGGSIDPPEVTVTGRRRPELSGVKAHQRMALAAIDVTRQRDIPVTTPARTLLDLGVVVPFSVFEAAAERALLRGLVTVPRLREVHERLGGRGRPGSAAMRAFLEERGEATAPTESPLELELVRLLRLHGLPPARRQLQIRTLRGGMVRLDLAYPEQKLGIEADGRLWHSGRADFQRDRTRGNALLQLGWRILRFTWDDVRQRPETVVADISRALASRPT